MMGAIRQAWERQPGESEPAWVAFRAYLDLAPPRTLPELAKVIGRSPKTLEKHKARWSWTERSAAWDDQLAQRESEVTLEEVAERRRRLLRSTAAMLNAADELMKEHARSLEKRAAVRETAALALDRTLEEAREKLGRGAKLTAREALALLKDCATLDRLILGEARQTLVDVGKLELLLLGEATERIASARIEQSNDLDLSQLTPEELEALSRLLAKASQAGG